jgi:hypothetical protein
MSSHSTTTSVVPTNIFDEIDSSSLQAALLAGSIDTHVDARTPMEGPQSQFSRGIWGTNGCMRNAHGL